MNTPSMVALCLVAGTMGGLSVAMLGAGQPGSPRVTADKPKYTEPAPVPVPPETQRWYAARVSASMSSGASNAKGMSPALVSAPSGGYVILVASTGECFIIDDRGQAKSIGYSMNTPSGTALVGTLNAALGMVSNGVEVSPQEGTPEGAKE